MKTINLNIVTAVGFTDVQAQKQKPIALPDELLRNYLTSHEIKNYQQDGRGSFSITVFATKPATEFAGNFAEKPADNSDTDSGPCCAPPAVRKPIGRKLHLSASRLT